MALKSYRVRNRCESRDRHNDDAGLFSIDRCARLLALAVALLSFGSVAQASRQQLPATPPEMTSRHFVVSVDGQQVPAFHAAANYYFLNFEARRHARIEVTADQDGFWDRGVEVQPWRLGIRPEHSGRTIRFTLDGPQKISITRPHDFLAGAEMLFLFANPKEDHSPKAASSSLRYYGPGIHRENIDAASGDNIYFAPEAVILGSLNLWDVHDVHVFGRGVIVYDGPQTAADDDSWRNKKNWHAIVMHDARNIRIEGITCVVRSRTWMIQMKDSRGIRFDNIKVIGGSESNANQDGMDWLGGGDTVVSNSFFRAADDIFAMQGNWEGYTPAEMAIPGHDVSNITVENSVVSTSISNVVRAAWPHKSFNSNHFVMRNMDVLHMGLGGCLVPFALLEIWADPEGTGHHSDYELDNIRMDDWYSLLQLRQPAPGISGVKLRDIFGMETPSLVPSALLGSVSGVQLDNVSLAGQVATKDGDVPLDVTGGASEPAFAAGAARASFTYGPGLVRPGQKVRFEAAEPAGGEPKIVHYEWTFGDGSRAHGRTVRHRFPDDQGTLRDGSGRFRVLLHTTDANGRNSWSYQPVVVAESAQPAVAGGGTQPGLQYRYVEASEPTLEKEDAVPAAKSEGVATVLDPSVRRRSDNYAIAFSGFVDVPAGGGYSFVLLGNDAASIAIDGRLLAKSPKPWPQVCGSVGNSVQTATGSISLLAGRHRIEVKMTHTTGPDGFRVLWQGTNRPLAAIPAEALSH